MKKGGGILAGEAAKSVRAMRSSAAGSGAAVKIKKSGNIKYCRGRASKPRSFLELELEELGGDFYHDFIDK